MTDDQHDNAVPICQRYKGRVAVITGGAQGLGRTLARRLAAEGAQIVLGDIQEEKVKRFAEALSNEIGREVLWSAGDLVKAEAAEALARTAIDAFGRIDTLVNNAAALIRNRLLDFDEDLLRLGVEANVWPALRCCRAVLPWMVDKQYGRIVNIGGEAWRVGIPFHTVLAGIGKGSLIGLTATLAGEMAKDGITVNCVSPGGYQPEPEGPDEPEPTPNPNWTPPEVLAELRSMGNVHPFAMPRLGTAQEVAGAIAYLGSPEASYVTGQHVGVNGGMVML